MTRINAKATPINDTCLTNRMGSVSCHITPLVINSLGGRHTRKHTHTHTDDPHRFNFKKPDRPACGRHARFKKQRCHHCNKFKHFKKECKEFAKLKAIVNHHKSKGKTKWGHLRSPSLQRMRTVLIVRALV